MSGVIKYHRAYEFINQSIKELKWVIKLTLFNRFLKCQSNLVMKLRLKKFISKIITVDG